MVSDQMLHTYYVNLLFSRSLWLHLILFLTQVPFNAYANRADQGLAGSSCKSCLIRVYSVCLWKYESNDPTLSLVNLVQI